MLRLGTASPPSPGPSQGDAASLPLPDAPRRTPEIFAKKSPPGLPKPKPKPNAGVKVPPKPAPKSAESPTAAHEADAASKKSPQGPSTPAQSA